MKKRKRMTIKEGDPLQCKGHKPVQKKIVTYLDYQNWVEAQIKKGKKQLRCPICKHWLFQSEWGSVSPNPFKTKKKNMRAEKAKELVKSFHHMGDISPVTTFGHAKACAIICVDTIIESWKIWDDWEVEYWQSVKEEINKL